MASAAVGTSLSSCRDLQFQVVDVYTCDSLRELDGPYELSLLCKNSTYMIHGEANDDGDDPFSCPNDASVDNNRHSKQENWGDRKPLTTTPTTVCVFGKTADGLNVVARIPYRPFLMVEVNDRWKKVEMTRFCNDICKWVRLPQGAITFTVERRSRAYGWIPKSKLDGSTTATFSVMRLRVPNQAALSFVNAMIRKNRTSYYQGASGPYQLNAWEAKVDLVHKFCDDVDVTPGGWMSIPGHAWRIASRAAAHADLEVHVDNFAHIVPLHDRFAMAPLVVASVDIECYSRRGFPVAPQDPIIGIGTSVKRIGSNGIERHYFALKETRLAENSPMFGQLEVRWFETQQELLFAWRDWFVKVNPDVVTGHNIFGFDFKYMADTVLHHSPGPNRWFFLGRLWGEPTPLKSSSFASNAHGHKVTHTFGMTGRLTVDALEIIRRDGTKKFRSYTLDFLASQILNKGKAGLTPDQIFGHYEGNATDRGVVAAYCAVDCDLVLELLLRLCTLQNVWEMAKITYTTPQDIVSQGQQIKVFHQIVWDAHRQSDARTQSDGFMANDPQNITVADYKGATVLEPQPGYYVEPITTLDFASLYPSIIIQHNLCMSTWVNNPDHLNIPGASYKTIDLGDGRQYTFVTHIPGILPTILKRLLAARSKVKKQMEKETDSFLVSILDAKQLALKVSCNSVYGFCGVALSSAKYPCMAVSESTTYFGRQMIATLKETIETRYPNSEVVYGDTDSVMIRFPVQNHPAPVKECFRLGSEVADLAHQMFGEHVNLTMEKVFQPYLLVCKKRYAGMSFTHPDKPAKLKISGLEVVRRDFAILVCKTQEAVLKAILEEQNVEKGKQIIWNKLNDLVENKIPFEEFVITCQLAAKYKNPNQLQTVLVDKMRERTPGSEPKSGDRIQYVVTEHKDQKAPISTKAEDAAYAQQHNVALDKLHYLTHMERPLSVLIEAMGHDAKRMFDHFRAKLHNQRHHLQDLRQYLVPRATGSDTVVSPSNATKPPTQITTKRKTASKPLNRFQQAAKAKQPDPRQPSLVSMLTPKRKI